MPAKLRFDVGDIINGFEFLGYDIIHPSDEGRVCGYWACHKCGNYFRCVNNRVKQGRRKSCGCLGVYTIDKLSKRIEPDYPWELVIYYARKRAIRDNLEFNITSEYLKEIYNKQQGKCIYTNEDIKVPKRYRDKIYEDSLSVDRIDSNLGYVFGNIQLVNKKINRMKNILSHQEFIMFCKKVANNFSDYGKWDNARLIEV